MVGLRAVGRGDGARQVIVRQNRQRFHGGKQTKPHERETPGFADGQRAIEGGGRFVADEAGGMKSLRFHLLLYPSQAVHHFVVTAGLDDLAGASERLPGAGGCIAKHDFWAVLLAHQ